MAKLGDLISDIRNQHLVLPEFQREYVWTQEQAKQLIISLFRGYPTGSLLFWKTPNPPELKNISFPVDKLGATQVMLDGQQRLTTLYLLLTNRIPPYYRAEDIKNDPRDLYFDLESGDFQYYQATRMRTNPTWVPVTACFDSTYGVKVFDIVHKKFSSENTVEEQFKLAQHYQENLTKLCNIVSKEYPVQIVPDSADIDAAIDVFDRVNSLGTKLTDAELALTHITGKWPVARRAMKKKLEDLGSKRFSFDLTFMVRSLIGIIHGRALYEVIHRTEREPLLEGWEKLQKILDYLVTVLPGAAFIHSTADLSSTNVLVPLIVYLARHEGKFSDDKELRHCIHWLYAAIMWSRYSSQTDQKLDHDISIVQRSDSPWKELVDAIIEQRGRIEVKPSDLEGRGIQHPLYRMMYIIAKSHNAVDWFNGIPLSAPAEKAYAINNCYVFPYNLLYKYGKYNPENRLHKELVNEIANRAFLTADSEVTLSDTDPSHYLGSIEQKYAGALSKQFVPLDKATWSIENFEGFLVARRKLIADAINSTMAGLITEPEIDVKPTLVDYLAIGESAVLEYKSSLRWDLKQQKYNSDLQKVICKTIAGFMNVEGGTLLIGVADNGTVLGIEYDLNHKPMDMSLNDRDKYDLLFRDTFMNYLDVGFGPLVHLTFERYEGHTVAIVEVERGPKPIYLKGKENGKDITEFYIRNGNTTKLLNVEESHNYIGMHWEP
ncbi:GmrSD restriction endonuclease domain-containing protein [Dictyobacter kobayashii]|uniref:DUF262 domain-containing protein n=1 Tax=Dictyobacter kobayashii TaxID=2014872 RepID=A0A402AVU6_9CHLR|nr:DUF262 domain-containing protein [Dictyobacter kobayashii]GCE23228.1 hypothetical protein KDK_70280 [Dictyobacter kobayashii]